MFAKELFTPCYIVHSISFDVFILRNCHCILFWASLNVTNWEETAVAVSFTMTKTGMWLQSFLLYIFSAQILEVSSSERMSGSVLSLVQRQGGISPLCSLLALSHPLSLLMPWGLHSSCNRLDGTSK